MVKSALLAILLHISFLKADFEVATQLKSNLLIKQFEEGYLVKFPKDCYEILDEFAQHASNLTLCSIINARPITLCEKCVDKYVQFREKYNDLLNRKVNATTCMSLFGSHDRLNVIQVYYNNIISVWNEGNCNGCFDWADNKPTLKNETQKFHKMYNDTMNCIINNMVSDNNEVCNKCMQSYLQLDEFYKTLSSDSIGVDSVCMDIVDSMNGTRSIWSKTLNCCNLRRTPEILFLCCAGIISFLPLLYYLAVRYYGPIKDLPDVLKQSGFKQTILKTMNRSE